MGLHLLNAQGLDMAIKKSLSLCFVFALALFLLIPIREYRRHLFDAGHQDLEEKGCFRLEQPVEDAFPVLGGRQRQLVLVSCRKDLRRGNLDSSESVPAHPNHGFFQSDRELPAADGPGNLVEFRVELG